jgi:hypothetical protein
MARFLSINRLEHSVSIEDALVDAEPDLTHHRWRVVQPGENHKPFYLPDALFHELFAPAEAATPRDQ